LQGRQLRVLDADGDDRRLEGSDFRRLTTADGRFEFDGLPHREYLVAPNPHGFRTVGGPTARSSWAAPTAPPRRRVSIGRFGQTRCSATSPGKPMSVVVPFPRCGDNGR
jgi:hypothetical protein